MHKMVRKVLRAVADYDPDYYDMYQDPNEALFAQLYVERIRRHAEEFGICPPVTEPGHPPEAGRRGNPEGVARGATLLEAGCQAGRLAVPFAKLGFRVTGIDTSGFALRRAREHAAEAGVEAEWLKGDLEEVFARQPGRRFDVVVCAEVLYLSPRHRELLRALAGAVRPGGLLCVSHRPRGYYLLEAIRQQDVSSAAEILSRSEGSFRDSAYYNWQTDAELRTMYDALGLQWIACYPIDRLAWLGGISPSQLTSEQQARWFELELQLPFGAEGWARYVLVVAARPEGQENRPMMSVERAAGSRGRGNEQDA